MTSESTEFTIKLREDAVGVGSHSKSECDGSKLDRSGIDDNKVDNEGDNEVGKKSRKNLSKSKKTESGFFISGARMIFTKLRQAFIKAPILHHFDLECHIRIETDESGYAISRVLSQLTLDNLD